MAFDPDRFLSDVPHRAGVYRMIDASGSLLYVGKARDLRARLASYFRAHGQPPKTRALVRHIEHIEFTVTETEAEALLLESNLIKAHRPRYNVLLRDDKSYPYIRVTTGQSFPRLGLYRGSKPPKGRVFGPYPSAGAVRETLNLLQKVFRVRQCDDGFFRNRSRPCLQYQIDRCSAPCVGYIDEASYRRDVEQAMAFLAGRSREVIDRLAGEMEAAAAGLDFETAARIRDRLRQLQRVTERHGIAAEGGDCDVIACATQANQCCVQVFAIRDGLNLGNKALFPQLPGETAPEAILAAVLPQYYLDRAPPARVVLSHPLESPAVLAEALGHQAGYPVTLTDVPRGAEQRWLEMAGSNADSALASGQAVRAGAESRWDSLQEALELPERPQRLECFDISHTQGAATVASCVVFDDQGPVKSDYRRFNIEGITAGDDYAALAQAVKRRYERLKRGEGPLPDVLFIDGGRGQVDAVREVLEELQVEGVALFGIAKGPSRKPGQERIVPGHDGTEWTLDPHHGGFHLIQQIRDEAHRFAGSGHRRRRGRDQLESTLESIPGLGPKRRQRLLTECGGLHGVRAAGVADLARVRGISETLARRIYAAVNGVAPATSETESTPNDHPG